MAKIKIEPEVDEHPKQIHSKFKGITWNQIRKIANELNTDKIVVYKALQKTETDVRGTLIPLKIRTLAFKMINNN